MGSDYVRPSERERRANMPEHIAVKNSGEVFNTKDVVLALGRIEGLLEELIRQVEKQEEY